MSTTTEDFRSKLPLRRRQAEARIHRVERRAEHGADLPRAQLFQLGEDEDVALVLVEIFQETIDDAGGFPLGGRLVGAVGFVGQEARIGALLRDP